MSSKNPLITADNLIDLNKRELQKWGSGQHRIHNEHSLRYAPDYPFLAFYGEAQFPSPYDKAAALMWIVIKDHIFENGNNRTGFAAAQELLQKLGEARFFVPKCQVNRVCRALERGDLSNADLAHWLHGHSNRSPL